MKLSNKFKNNRELIITIAIVLGIVIVINFLSTKIFWRADLTHDKIYSTSNITKTTLKELPKEVNVKIYFSKDLPNQYLLLKQQLEDILATYHGYGSKFNYQFIDPGDGKEAESLGIPKLQFNDIRQDKLEVVSGYMGMVVNYQDKQEIIPVIQDTQSLEYELISMIKKMTASLQPIIGVVTGHNSLSLGSDLQILNNEIKKIYQIKAVDLTKPVPSDIKTLIIAGVKNDLSDTELKNLDKFLISDKSVIVLQDGVDVITSPINLNTENKSNLNDLLIKYGITIHKELIADIYSGIASFNQGAMAFSVNYPVWPKIIKANFEQNNPIVSHLNSVILPWASNLTIDKSKISTGSTISELAKTSDKAWAIKANELVNPTKEIVVSGQAKQYVMAASINNDINSVYGQGQGKLSRLIVVGDSDFIKDDFIQGDPNNLIFIQNLIDGATLDSGLATIRSKDVVARPIKDTTEQQKQIFRFINVFGVTIALIILGITRYYFRKKTKTMEI